jgi:hypothetical protein
MERRRSATVRGSVPATRPSKGIRGSDAVMAAAMQDHFMKSIDLGNLSLSGPPRRTVIRRPSRLAQQEPKPLEAVVGEVEPIMMTLAQKLGLVAPPPARLTQVEWQEAAQKARHRDDSTSECAICREAFKAEGQVILSCSHVFHKACLASFERSF